MKSFFDRVILSHPRWVFLLIIVTIAFFGYQARKLEIDASSETLLLEDDKDLALSRKFSERFGSTDFLFIAFTPKAPLLSEQSLGVIRGIKSELSKLDRVKSINSILDVPLLESPPKPVMELVKDVPTLESGGVDKELAKQEFLNSPIYEKNLVSKDFKTTGLLVNLHEDEVWRGFIKRRNALKEKQDNGTITEQEERELEQLAVDFKAHRDKVREIEHENIKKVREILSKYEDEGELFLGGVSMIADDLITFIRNDLKWFGIGVLIFLIVMLWIIFRQLRWILLPVLCCAFSVIVTSGILGLSGWEVTVISSNFISIQIIITMAITIHLIVRYRELAMKDPSASQRELVLEATHSMAKPCTYAILTTMAGFSSLVFSGIRPVINFGWMMTAGIGISLILTFLIFPALMMQMEKVQPNTSFESFFSATKKLAAFTERHGKGILITSVLLLILSIVGSNQLIVENSFIDYFKKDTEIYQGMAIIDQKLGGTTPLDVVISFDRKVEFEEVDASELENLEALDGEEGLSDLDDLNDLNDVEELDELSAIGELEGLDELGELDELESPSEFDELEDLGGPEDKQTSETQYWFTSVKMEQIEKVHDYLNSLDATGKVLSLGTMLKVGRTLNDGDDLDAFLMAMIYDELPEEFREIILTPYVSLEHNQARFSVRIIDSMPDLRRDELLKQIRHDLVHKLEFNEENVFVAGMMVMYNNMLQSLFDSQIMTLGAVIAVLGLMFLILFRSIRIALIAIFPNILSVGVVLGFMGWVGIPLDLMTITIAAISVGIAVDDTIHYIHRFIREFEKDRNYIAAMHRCHQSIGYAMYYTSITIIFGFSILVLSNFIPTIYFGLLTGLAMLIALIAALTLLPQLIVLLKPLGPEGSFSEE